MLKCQSSVEFLWSTYQTLMCKIKEREREGGNKDVHFKFDSQIEDNFEIDWISVESLTDKNLFWYTLSLSLSLSLPLPLLPCTSKFAKARTVI